MNPLAGNAPFPGNQIPVSMLNPVAVKMATNYLPISAADQCGKVTYGIPVTGDEDQFIGRIDFAQNAKHTLFGRYFMDAFKNPPTYDGKNVLTTTQAGNLEMAQSATIGDTYTFGPGTLNSLHAHLQPPARRPRTDGYSDQSDAARGQHVQRRAELPAALGDRRVSALSAAPARRGISTSTAIRWPTTWT